MRTRLDRAFSAAGLRAEDFVVILPHLSLTEYWNLNLVGDVFLDTIGCSSGVSIHEAIACGVPVVTYPDHMMRGREGYAILTQLGMPETIADNLDDYVEIAARLGMDAGLRNDIKVRMKQNEARLFSDTRCVRTLEAFFESAVLNFSPLP